MWQTPTCCCVTTTQTACVEGCCLQSIILRRSRSLPPPLLGHFNFCPGNCWQTFCQPVIHLQPRPSPQQHSSAPPAIARGAGLQGWIPGRQFLAGYCLSGPEPAGDYKIMQMLVHCRCQRACQGRAVRSGAFRRYSRAVPSASYQVSCRWLHWWAQQAYCVCCLRYMHTESIRTERDPPGEA